MWNNNKEPLVIVVYGKPNIGKTAFIKCSLPNSVLRHNPNYPNFQCHRAKLNINNKEYFLEIIEVNEFKHINQLPIIHGGLLCYKQDALNLSKFELKRNIPTYKIELRPGPIVHVDNGIQNMDVFPEDLQHIYISLLMETHDPSTTSEDEADSDDTILNPSLSPISCSFSPSQNKMSRCGSNESSDYFGTGLSIEDLLDRLLSKESDKNMLPIFFTFYRKFMRPTELIKQLVERFENDGFLPFLTEQQKRIHNAFVYWLSYHWNDFYAPQARRYMIVFLDRISKYDAFTPICDNLAPLVVREPPLTDPDGVWGMTDQDVFSNSKKDSGYLSGTFDLLQDTPPQSPLEDKTASSVVHHNSHSEIRRTEFAGGMINIDASNSKRNYTASTLTATSGWTTHLSIMSNFRTEDKLNMKLFMKSTDLHIAKQLTWIETQIFSRIEDREFIRNMWNNGTNLTANNMVSASIAHFNFISAWVATLIVSQPRTSKRASLLLKFMSIAIELRNLYNYNSLMAVLAGINSASILRLKQTRQAVIGKKLYKQFQSLERLMSTDKSFSSYRMALKATKGPGIPYLGVHNQDLVSLAEANKDHRIDGTIHWDKFRLMGETIMSIMKFKYEAYAIEPDLKLLSSIADCPLLSEEEQYKKSILVEPKVNPKSSNRLKDMWLRLK
ncbi:hypothetical protein G6F55_000744 [Rhizopus delemar]|uniref:Ras GEF n=1 Tax=Rhizopus delemar TaxID=936053 RepID=A0A9P7CUY1_9FUNG|nr:hypothetical protein G6F55_000744 [Rhizopus delemar]KAG1636437.1 hypothetical protein G6F45_001291 [Rhizopus arrhizus]KAG1528380.1 hypothetical protein G6F52_000692 [Rhizopus delemar]KAG1562599.1 hypothetical protein G6F49_000764 [Rhizopus delemar]KAG1575767.1 hypothetical protein G6F50_000797 [Rhizopus delemar]